MNIDMLRIAVSLLAILSSKDKRFCNFICTILLRRFSHPFQLANYELAICLPRKEEDHD